MTCLGLQCHTAPFSWKVVFESDHQLFEVLCSAATAEEERLWRLSLTEASAKAAQSLNDIEPLPPQYYSHIYADLKPVGSLMGHPGTLARRLSVQQAATIGPCAEACQVVIRDTSTLSSEAEQASAEHSIRFGRSRSLLSTHGRIPVLCPRRSDRIRIEQGMAKVWTREVLPYPVMTLCQREHSLRASASSVIRKLSRASIASGFSRRTTSPRSSTITESSGESQESRSSEAHGQAGIQGNCTSLASPPPSLHCMQGPLSIVTQRHVWRLRRRGSKARTETRRSKDDLEVHSRAQRNGSCTEEECERKIKSRWSSPAALLDSFTSDGFRGLFT